jgi:hypothetical protein
MNAVHHLGSVRCVGSRSVVSPDVVWSFKEPA